MFGRKLASRGLVHFSARFALHSAYLLTAEKCACPLGANGRRFLLTVLAGMAGTVLLGCLPAAARDKNPSAEKQNTPSAATSGHDSDNPHVWKPRTRSVAVFKNGLGFFMRDGGVQLREGWCVAEEIPPATFGTLAIYSQNEQETVDLVGTGPGEVVEFDGRDAPGDVATKRARLEACKNLKVELWYEHKSQTRTAAGKLISVGPEFVALDSGQNSLAVPLAGLKKMQILELPLRVHIERDAKKSIDRTQLGMAYLRKGITWIPDYTLKVLDDETAELTLRGTLVNEAEDLIHTDVHFVVGVPHFAHTDFMAPAAIGQVIRTIGAAVSSQVVPQAVRTQIMNRAAIVSNVHGSPQQNMAGVVEQPVAPAGDLAGALGNLPQLGGAAATDYTVYTKKDLTIRRGEKAIVTLMVRKIHYAHLYRWSPPERMQHALVLHNTTDSAWTTGPCLALSTARPLSEDLLKYTPKGGDGELPLTAAINIAHDKEEREIDRQTKAHSPSHNLYYDLVTLEGKLTLRNFDKRSAHVLITNPVPGKPTLADREGKMSMNATKLKLSEREGSIRWDLTLDPGASMTITYKYERYVPSH